VKLFKSSISSILILSLMLLLFAGFSGVAEARTGSITEWQWTGDWPLDPPLPDHLWVDLGGGEEAMFLHFNQSLEDVDDPFDPDFLNENLMYVGLAIRGRFFAEERPTNPAYTHFHQLSAESPEAGHGGEAGDEGYWLVHIAVQDLERPWGEVEPGVDFDFMPTEPPAQFDDLDIFETYDVASATDWEWRVDWPMDPPLPDHLWIDLGRGRAMFLHYDRPVDEEGAELIYVGDAIRGRFTAEAQPDIPGFVHFHQLEAESVDAGHGGAPGAEGYWLRHIAVRDMEMPWGEVEPGVDFNFMVTDPPAISE